MEEIVRRKVLVSVLRGCGFGALTIVTGMIGAANSLPLFLKTGGYGMLLMAFILILKASRADRIPYRKTEVWIMLDTSERPPDALAAAMIANARREIMLEYAYYSAITGVVLIAFELLVTLLG